LRDFPPVYKFIGLVLFKLYRLHVHLMERKLNNVIARPQGIGVYFFSRFSHFFHIFSCPIEAKRRLNPILEYNMRAKRILVQGASWYEVRTAVNNREPLFWQQQAIEVFCRVLGEARRRFVFELRGFRLEGEWLSFYIKPEDGLRLPAIMQWVKQTFAVRFNRRTGRTGHVWGDRYWSKVLEGEPPEEAAEVDWAAVAAKTGESSFRACSPNGVSPLTAENPAEGGFLPQNSAHPPSPPG
jgi:hypothetical protein